MGGQFSALNFCTWEFFRVQNRRFKNIILGMEVWTKAGEIKNLHERSPGTQQASQLIFSLRTSAVHWLTGMGW